MDIKLEHFNETELACRCCDKIKINNKALIMIQALRYLCGFPIRVSSAYRCPSHNKTAGGVSKSSHLKGTGFDIKISKAQKSVVIKNCLNMGFSVGIYDKHIHIDVRAGGPKLWCGKSS